MYEIKDSGQRTEFSTGARRDCADGKGRYDLLPTLAIRRVALQLENGARKYGDENWRRGIPFRRYVDSAMRHIDNYRLGMCDEDHLAAAAWNILCLIETQILVQEGILPAELDDLYRYGGHFINGIDNTSATGAAHTGTQASTDERSE